MLWLQQLHITCAFGDNAANGTWSHGCGVCMESVGISPCFNKGSVSVAPSSVLELRLYGHAWLRQDMQVMQVQMTACSTDFCLSHGLPISFPPVLRSNSYCGSNSNYCNYSVMTRSGLVLACRKVNTQQRHAKQGKKMEKETVWHTVSSYHTTVGSVCVCVRAYLSVCELTERAGEDYWEENHLRALLPEIETTWV